MQEKWVIRAKKADFYQIAQEFQIDPVVARLLVNRGVKETEDIRRYLRGDERDLYDPLRMKDLGKAVDLILEYLKKEKKVAVASDYDVDGIMSGFILKTAFLRLGADCTVYTPDRIAEGYGLNQRIVDQAYESGARLLITCDNGIAAFEPVFRAKQLGMTVIVTDHHEVPFKEEDDGTIRPLSVAADAVLDPKQEDCGYPYKNLCGAGVAFKLICALYDRVGISNAEKYDLLEYTAIATVADVMELTDENRILVRLGLDRLKHTKNLGLRALIQENQLNPLRLNAYQIGFVIGPCLNAAGRLQTAKLAFDLLEARDERTAAKLAAELKALNDSRKDLTAVGFAQAVDIIENSTLKNDRVLLVLLEECHESLVGIIAGKIKEKYYRPTIVFTRTEEGLLKGSGRSIEAYHMFKELTRQRHLLKRFGGHAMAAGLTIREENLEKLRVSLNESAKLTQEDLTPVVRIDMLMPIDYVTENLIDQIESLEPYGQGNPKPVFAERHFRILSARIVGKNQNVLRLRIQNENRMAADAVYFGDIPEFETFVEREFGAQQKAKMFAGEPNFVDLAMTYYPDLDEYRGRRQIQFVITGYQRLK